MDTSLELELDSDSTERLPSAALNPPLRVEKGPYRMRFARTVRDLAAAQRLRYRVFNEELGEGFAESALTGRDEDEFDSHCQHLLVEDSRGDVVGTYRVQLAGLAARRGASGLYSATEFDLSGIAASALDAGVELGRACVHVDHRHRSVLFLLWHGLIGYCLHHEKRAFFGCSSLTSVDPAEGVRFHRWLAREGYLHPTHRVRPHAAFACTAPESELDAPPPKVPKLFGMYLRVGAKVLGPPAIDREFKTIDYLTWVDLTPEIARAYGHPDAELAPLG